MSEETDDYEYNVDNLAQFYYHLSMVAGSAVIQGDTELLEEFKVIALLLPSRLPPNMNMMDLTLIGMPSDVREYFEAEIKKDNYEWTDVAMKRRGSQEAT